MFPALWFGLLILWALGAPAQSDAKSVHDERVLVVIAAVVAGLGLVAAVLDWAQMRGRCSPEERTPIRSAEGAVSAVVAVAALAVAIGIGGVLWNLVP